MASHTTPPAPSTVGPRAATILDRITATEEYARLNESTRRYPDCGTTFAGYPIIAQWDLSRDAGPLFIEAMRVLALNAAVCELSGGDDQGSALDIPAPVDEMVHAVLAQHTLCLRMTRRLGINFAQAADRERSGYRAGNYIYECYLAAGWGVPSPRYWIEEQEAARRLKILNDRYESIGVYDDGRRHDIAFNAEPPLTHAG